MKRLLLFIVLASVPVAYISCGNPAKTTTPAAPAATPLQKVSAGLLNLAKSVGDTQTAMIRAHDQKLISDTAFVQIMTVCLKVSMAGKQADALVAHLAVLSPTDKQNVAAVLVPVVQAVNDTLNSGLVQIGDANTQAAIRASILTVQTVLGSIQLAVAQ